ncbi:Disease resistance protein L6 [Linum perenne]
MRSESGSSLSSEYEVFLSFRSPDIRQTFADCLYSCLVRSKIRTFRDEEELQRGESIGQSLVKAITESKVYIPIFTHYASSKWCLQELAKIVECWKTGGGAKGQHVIFPVFYFIDPRDVRLSDSGSYKEAFELHSLKHDPETILEWKEALREVGEMKGWHVTESDGQGAIIDQIFTEVEFHLKANYTLVTDDLVGIDFHMEEVMKLLNLDYAAVKIVGIHGMGGLGKTTLAKAVYNKVSTQFERCCFLENITNTLSKSDGPLTLQNKIISDILRNDSSKATDTSDGIRVIRERVCKHKLLIVLDDVDEKFQFDDILGKLDDFSVDSRFLITTRDARVLGLLQECKLFELEEMSHDHSLKLFCKHAFRVDYPREDYATLVEEFVQVAAGLPLALKVIGSLLFQTDKRFWKDKLTELKEIPPTKVQDRLKISYNELTRNEKQIFLDVACLFVGMDKELPIYMWSDCDFYPTSTIKTLVERSLLKMDEMNRFWMHDHVRDLGRAIVREENNQNPYKRSRICSNSDAINMLKNREVAHKLKAVRLSGCTKLDKVPDLSNCEGLELLDLNGCRRMRGEVDIRNFKNLRWLACNWTKITKLKGEIGMLRNLQQLHCSHTSLTEVPAGISKLSFLELFHLTLTDPNKPDFKEMLPDSLKSLRVSSSYLPVLPSSLISLEICYSKDLLWVPGLANLTNLTQLNLWDVGIYEIPGLGELKLLASLFIQSAPNLGNLDGLVNLVLLEELTVERCSLLKKLPSLASLTRLQMLKIRRCQILSEIYGVEDLCESLSHLDISWCSSLTSTVSLHSMVKLETLVLMGVELTGMLPVSLSKFTKLTTLTIHQLSVKQFPDLSNLKKLKCLTIGYCKELIEVTGLHALESLKLLVIIHCLSIRKLPDLSRLRKLSTLDVRGCTQLTEISRLGRFKTLKNLYMSNCKSIKELPNLSGLRNLRRLRLRNCRQLKEVNGLEGLQLLQMFVADKRLKVKYLLKSVSRYGKQLVTRSVPSHLFINN